MLRILFFLGWISLSSSILSQSQIEVYDFALSQYSKGNYTLALKEFERCLFFEANVRSELLRYLADSYSKLGDYEKASEYYEKAFNLETIDTLRLVDLYRKVECQIQAGDFALALVDLLAFNDSLSAFAEMKLKFLSGICYFGMNDFANSEKYFLESIESRHIEEKQKITEIFRNKKLLSRPDPHTAYLMSICFPGLGQFYSGDIRNSLNSFLLTTIIAMLGAEIALNQSLLDAGIILLPWFQRYYQGGMLRAESIAIEKRRKNRSRAFDKIISIIASTKN